MTQIFLVLHQPQPRRGILDQPLPARFDLIRHGALSYSPATGEVRLSDQPVDLSRRELALLATLLQHPGRIVSLERLHDSLYGYEQGVESNAVNVHIHHLRRKLGAGIVETVRGQGYRLGSAGETQP